VDYPEVYQHYLSTVRSPKIRALKLAKLDGHNVDNIEVTQIKNPRIKELTQYEEDLLVDFLLTQPDDMVVEFLLHVMDIDYDLVENNKKIETFLARKEFQKYRKQTYKLII
jgi:hypothetical protein